MYSDLSAYTFRYIKVYLVAHNSTFMHMKFILYSLKYEVHMTDFCHKETLAS